MLREFYLYRGGLSNINGKQCELEGNVWWEAEGRVWCSAWSEQPSVDWTGLGQQTGKWELQSSVQCLPRNLSSGALGEAWEYLQLLLVQVKNIFSPGCFLPHVQLKLISFHAVQDLQLFPSVRMGSCRLSWDKIACLHVEALQAAPRLSLHFLNSLVAPH